MRRVVKIVSEGEYQDWLNKQQSYYLSTIRGTEDDPNKDILFESEIKARRQEFNDNLEKALSAEEAAAKTLLLNHVNFETGSANLSKLSVYQLDNLADALNKYPNMAIEISGHTDNTGDPESNQQLSEQRAQKVKSYLVDKGIAEGRLTAVGYGSSRPVAGNDTEEGREQNRRTEFRITAQ